ncbi:MAG: DUF4391 domain-containing protein [Acidobacteriota bacterium]|nr:DUF4391 domain-containing protein [Acidobacteriota bacterium]
MTADALIATLDLSPGARVDRRVPKTLLVEHGAPTPADRRQVNDAVEALVWVAALKPATIGVPAFRDDVREYLEIAVLRMTLREVPGGRSAASARLTELVHRAVPYPVILCVDHRDSEAPGNAGVSLSAAHKRWSQGEAGKTVLDGDVVVVAWDGTAGGLSEAEIQALSLSRQPQASMLTVYQGWVDALTTIAASRVTGALTLPVSPQQAADRQAALTELKAISREMDRLRAAARRETQVARQVDLNMKLKAMQARRTAAEERLR